MSKLQNTLWLIVMALMLFMVCFVYWDSIKLGVL